MEISSHFKDSPRKSQTNESKVDFAPVCWAPKSNFKLDSLRGEPLEVPNANVKIISHLSESDRCELYPDIWDLHIVPHFVHVSHLGSSFDAFHSFGSSLLSWRWRPSLVRKNGCSFQEVFVQSWQEREQCQLLQAEGRRPWLRSAGHLPETTRLGGGAWLQTSAEGWKKRVVWH